MARSVVGLAGVFNLATAHDWTGLGQPALSPEGISANKKGCYCASATIYNNERTASDAQGGGCVGGCGGRDFEIHKAGAIVESIRIWYGTDVDANDGIKAIRISYFGDLDGYTVGNPLYTAKEITFKPGETISGDVIISGNGFGTRAGYVSFDTSGGQKFAAGQDSHTKYYFNSGDSFISGIFGRAEDDINSLAFIFWKPIQKVRYLNIAYPTLDSIAKIKNPAVIASQDFCNDNPVARPTAGQTLERDETTGHDSCFTAQFSEDYGMSVEVKASIPELGDETDTAHWDISATQTFENCHQHSTTTKQQFVFPSPTLQPHTRTSYQFTQWQGRLSDIPYTATLQLVFQDGQTMTRTENGSYKGTSFLSVQQSWTDYETNVTDCSKHIMV